MTSQWQPIETAPIDGTPILLWCDETPRIVVAEWAQFEEWQGWVFSDAALADIQPEGPSSPTYWMPLPPPPQEDAP